MKSQVRSYYRDLPFTYISIKLKFERPGLSKVPFLCRESEMSVFNGWSNQLN
jgi:hypothetical protein